MSTFIGWSQRQRRTDTRATSRPRRPRDRDRGRRLRRPVGLLLAVAASVATVGVAGQAPSYAATSRPTLTFSNASTQSTLGSAYTQALTNLLDTNTVSYDPATYNSSGLMTTSPQTFIRAGGGYSQPWTRDASVNSWNAASLLEPKVAANTLWSAVVKQSNGQLILVQDNETWDQVVWMTAAWNHYLVTGDQTFLANAYQVAANTLNLRKSQNFNSTYGLFQGPAFFNDGIAGYPAPPADSTESQGSYVGSYSAANSMMTLSTNELYYSAYRSAALMASALGKSSSEVGGLNSSADSLKTKINQYLWNPNTGLYGYFLHNGDSQPTGSLDQTEEGTGLSFAILFGIASPSQAQSIMQNAHIQPYGVVDTYPNFTRYSATQPGRHNVIVWPMVQGMWADAAAQSGEAGRFASEVEDLAGLANTSGQFAEIYNAQSGAVDGGWQTGSHWGAASDQTWSATAYLRMIHNDLFGIQFTTSGITFAPTLPWGWGDATLSNVPYRGANLTIALHGAGSTISAFTVDGTSSASHTVPTSLTGSHTVDITLTGGTPGAVRSFSNTCLDNAAASTANGNPVQIWGCDGSSAQQWSVHAAGAGSTVQVQGKCLDATGNATANGTKVELWDCNGGANQVWVAQSNGSLLNPQSGRCLDDTGWSTNWGTQAELWDCNAGANQRWYLPA